MVTDADTFFPARPSKSQRRKVQILEKSIGLFATRGLDLVTYDDIARACGVTRPLVQHYFPNRDDFVLLTMKYIRAIFQRVCVAAISRHTTPHAQLLAYLDATAEWIDEYSTHARVWLLFYYFCGIKKKYRSLNTELVRVGQERIASLVSLGAARGEFRPLVNEAEALARAKLIQRALTAYLLTAVTEEGVAADPAELAATRELCVLLANGNRPFSAFSDSP